MNILIGNSFTEKTTCLFQIGYNFLDKQDNSDDYIYYITQSFSLECKNQLLGKYNMISGNIIERIQIKVCDRLDVLITFLKNLFFIPKDLCPSIILIDNLNLFYRIQKGKFLDDIYYLKQYEILSSILTLIHKLNKDKKIEFVISINMDLCINYNQNLENEEKENINILDCLICYCNKIFNFVYTKENQIQCYQLKLNFNPKYSISFIEYKNEVISIDEIKNENNYIERAILEFDELVNKYYQNLKNELN
jgi:hypothetical protein